jgi:predicted MFS family arabinose efflux permease
VLAAVGAIRFVNESRSEGRSRYDLPGALAATLGLVAVVYGFTEAETRGWSDATTIVALAAGVAMLLVFVLIESRSAHPLLPLRVVTERNRGGAFLVSLLAGTGLYGMFLLLTYYLQGSLGYSPLKTGLAFLPFSAGVVVSAIAASSLLTRLAPRVIMVSGLVMAAAGLLLFTQVGVHTGFLTHVLPGLLIMSCGLGLVFVPISSTALIGVSGSDSGVASAMINTTQQVGGSIGVSLLNTLAASATTTYVVSRLAAHEASRRTIQALGVVHGYDVAFGIAAGFIVTALATTAFLVTAKKEDIDSEQAAVFG